jgi:hypothetical protein
VPTLAHDVAVASVVGVTITAVLTVAMLLFLEVMTIEVHL